jgi:hypothetical protein
MKPFAVGCAVLVVIAVVLAIVVILRLSRGPIVLASKGEALPKVSVEISSSDPTGFTLAASLSRDVEGFFITDISAPRACAIALGLTAPPGFREEAMPLEAKERKDPEVVEFARKFDAENILWAGSLPVAFGKATLVRLPATAPTAGTCKLSVGYERRGRFGGMAAQASVTIGQGSGGAG